jgi:hypothetical protein
MRKSVIQGSVIMAIALVFSATAKTSLAQCRTVDLPNLKLEESTNTLPYIWHIKDITNEWVYTFIGDPDSAHRFYSILEAYKVKTICNVPASATSYDDTVYDELLLTDDGKPIKGELLPKSQYEQCVAFEPSALYITYSDTEEAKVLTDGKTVLGADYLNGGPLQDTLSMIQQYSLDTICRFDTGALMYNYAFGYYKSQHPPQTKTILNTANAFQLYGKVAPRGALDDRALRREVAAINDQTNALARLVAKEINARAIKWPPNPRDPIIRELLARESAIEMRTVSVYSRPHSAKEPRGLETFAALRPLAGQLHRAVETFMRSKDAQSGGASLKQIVSMVDAIKAKAAEIK